MVDDTNNSLQLLEDHRRVWREKPILRDMYAEWYNMITSHMTQGRTVEIGGGGGNFKEHCPEAISADIVSAPWVDMVFDAHSIPFADGDLANIIMVDVLHHLENPMTFLREAARVLRSGGRVLLVEPYVSPLSYPIYRWLHPEPLDMRADPFKLVTPDPQRQPFDSNQAVPTLLFWSYAQRFFREMPEFQMLRRDRMAYFAYPLSGGFGHRGFLPEKCLAILNRCEKLFKPLAALLAFRTFVVLEKR